MANVSKIKLPNNTTYKIQDDTGEYSSHLHYTNQLSRPNALRGVSDVTLQGLFNATRANRLAFLPASQVIVEITTDGGTTWVDAGVSDATKLGLFSETRYSISIPLLNGVRSPLCGVRVTITAMRYNVPSGTAETNKYNYWNSTYVASTERYNQLKEFYFWLSASDGSIGIKIEGAKGNASTDWVTVFDDASYYMTGWSGCDYVRLSSQYVFGGGTTQYTNAYWNYRLTFMSKGKNGTDDFDTSSKTQAQTISEIRAYGDSYWTKGNEYAATDKIYTHDNSQNVTFPNKVTATGGFTGALTGTASNASKVNNHTVNSDVPANAVFTDTTYSEATTSVAGLMSAADKTLLNKIPSPSSSDSGKAIVATSSGGYQLSSVGSGTITGVTGGTGLSGSGTSGSVTINHSNSVTAQTTQAVYPIKIDAQGHISSYGSAVTIPAVDTAITTAWLEANLT